MRQIILLLLFLTFKVQAQVAFGGKLSQSNSSAATIGDFHTFDLSHQDMFGVNRYGIGRGQFDIESDRVGAFGDSRSGALIRRGSGLNLGLEPMNGMIGYHNKPEYQWEPGVSVGMKETISGVQFYAGPRIGLSYNNTGNDQFYGKVIQVQFPKIGLTYWENDYRKMSVLRILDFNIGNRLNIQQRYEKGDILTMVGVRFDL
jgi:hypothetical protein